MHENIIFKRIGTISSPYHTLSDMPIQPIGARNTEGRITLLPELAEGLCDLQGFSHLILLYHFHNSQGYALSVTPFLDTQKRGLFATRAPRRPNSIGLSVVELLRVEGTELIIKGIDVLNGTPLLDIKPYVPAFDSPAGPVRTGWLESSARAAQEHRSDARFTNGEANRPR